MVDFMMAFQTLTITQCAAHYKGNNMQQKEQNRRALKDFLCGAQVVIDELSRDHAVCTASIVNIKTVQHNALHHLVVREMNI